MALTGAQIVFESLIREGVEVIFGFPGGTVLPFYDTLPQYPQIRHVLVRHEQGAAHAADAYARATGKPGVCVATSGPGATNLVTGIATAHLDSSPVVAITGQVARPYIGKDAFQEIDITGITLPITKHNYIVLRADDIAQVMKEAFYLATSGRPGPVLVDIPRDVFVEQADFQYPAKVDLPGYKPVLKGHPAQIKKAARFINQAQRPLIIAGRGVTISRAFDELRQLAEKAQIPVITTLLGISSFPQNHMLSLGMLGMHGLAYANLAVDEADLVVAIGMRFDDRATMKAQAFAAKARIVHIDIDPAEIGKNIKVDVPIVGDAKSILKELNEEVVSQARVDWVNQIDHWRHEHPSLAIRGGDELLPQFVIHSICEATDGSAMVVTGVGQHQMWSAQHYCFKKPNRLISSGGLGTMGFELPAAIGVKIGCPDETVWCMAGDGSLQMTIQELATAAQERTAIKIAILNNGYLGMVRQWQELLNSRRYSEVSISSPDLVKLCDAFGILGLRAETKEQVAEVIAEARSSPGPVLIDFVVEQEVNVYPMVQPGKALHEMLRRPVPE
jgi:acetolactate synthase-1/2/3 large subunit